MHTCFSKQSMTASRLGGGRATGQTGGCPYQGVLGLATGRPLANAEEELLKSH